MDLAVLYGAIATLCGVIGALAKVAWTERGSRLDSCEKEISYYKEQVMPTMNRVLDGSDKLQTSLTVLTKVFEDSVRRGPRE